MGRYLADTIRDLQTADRNAARRDNRVPYCVAVEAGDGSWFELSHLTLDEAKASADRQVLRGDVRGASVWRINNKGKFPRRPAYTVFQPVGDDA